MSPPSFLKIPRLKIPRLQDPRSLNLLFSVTAVIIVLDQATKLLVHSRMALHESIPVFPSFFQLTYIRNPGAAFGIFAGMDSGFRTTFFVLISIAALVFLGNLYLKIPRDSLMGRFSVSLIIGGAVGNLVDRIRFGEVVDFLDFFIGRHHWPAFNVADSAISVGVGLLILHFIRSEKADKTATVKQG